jgi:DNA-binding NtrC family response regulator
MSHPRSRYNIFVVDDEYIIASTLAVILRGEGFDAMPFSKPLDALHAIGFDTPDLLLSDVVMPMMSGVDLAIEVLKHCPACRVLLFSGAVSADLLIAAKANGYQFDLLSKPAHPRHLLRTVQNVLDAPNRREQ